MSSEPIFSTYTGTKMSEINDPEGYAFIDPVSHVKVVITMREQDDRPHVHRLLEHRDSIKWILREAKDAKPKWNIHELEVAKPGHAVTKTFSHIPGRVVRDRPHITVYCRSYLKIEDDADKNVAVHLYYGDMYPEIPIEATQCVTKAGFTYAYEAHQAFLETLEEEAV